MQLLDRNYIDENQLKGHSSAQEELLLLGIKFMNCILSLGVKNSNEM